MKLLITIFICFIFSLSSIGYCQQKPFTHDGRYGSVCGAVIGGIPANVNACWISFFQLGANVEKYDGKTVIITGYLVIEGKRFYLYPTNEASHRLDLPSAIWIDDSPENLNLDKPVFKSPIWVRVAGNFDAKIEGHDGMRLGKIDKILFIEAM